MLSLDASSGKVNLYECIYILHFTFYIYLNIHTGILKNQKCLLQLLQYLLIICLLSFCAFVILLT